MNLGILKEKTEIKIEECFDYEYYLNKYPDVIHSELDPLTHYIKFGDSEGRDPTAYFSTNYYRKKYLKGKKKNSETAFHHYLRYGAKNNFETCIDYSVLKKTCLRDKSQIIGRSKESDPIFFNAFFDLDFLRSQISDDNFPLDSFCFYLWANNRDKSISPFVYFDPLFYLAKYSDVLKANRDPFIHFLQFGINEMRVPSLFVDRTNVDLILSDFYLTDFNNLNQVFTIKKCYSNEIKVDNQNNVVGSIRIKEDFIFGDPNIQDKEDLIRMIDVYSAYMENN